MTITRKGLCEEVEGFDRAIERAQASKRAAFQAYREQLKADGNEPTEIKLEISSFKAAMQRKRRFEEDPAAVEEADGRTDEILHEIMGTRVARVRAKSSAGFETAGEAPEAIADVGEEGAKAVHPAENTAPRAEAPSDPEEISPPVGVHAGGAEGDGREHEALLADVEQSIPHLDHEISALARAAGAGDQGSHLPGDLQVLTTPAEPAPPVPAGSVARETGANTPVATPAKPVPGPRDARANSDNDGAGTSPAGAGSEGAVRPVDGPASPARQPRRPRVVPSNSPRQATTREEGAADRAPSSRASGGYTDFDPIPPSLRRHAAE